MLWFASWAVLAGMVLCACVPITDLGVVFVPYWNESHVPRCCVCRRWCASRSVTTKHGFVADFPGFALDVWDGIRLGRWLSSATELHSATPWKAWNTHSPRSWGVTVQAQSCNLVDPASSHMLVSKIKPCMSKYKLIHAKSPNFWKGCIY